MKTDLYYVVETLSGHLNLQERTKQWMKQLFKRNKVREPAFIKVFAVIYAAGIVFVIWFFIRFAYPQFLHFLEHARDYLSYPVTNFYFWDGVLFIILNGLSLLLLFYSWIRQFIGYIRSRSSATTAG